MVPRLLVGTEIEEALYEGSAEAIVSEAAEQLGCLLLVGHEPELLSLIVTRTGARVLLPTAGLAVIALDSWQGGGRLLALATPRLLEAAASAE